MHQSELKIGVKFKLMHYQTLWSTLEEAVVEGVDTAAPVVGRPSSVVLRQISFSVSEIALEPLSLRERELVPAFVYPEKLI